MADHRFEQRRKSLKRQGYWDDPSINRWHEAHLDATFSPEAVSELAHRHLSDQYCDRHKAGDPDAIFEYARADTWCFRSAWVVEQVERWRDAGEGGKLRSLMASFSRNAQKGDTETLVTTIRQDQAIFKRITARPARRTLDGWFRHIADERECSGELVWQVYEMYRHYWERQCGLGVTREEFFRRLAEMADRIEGYGNARVPLP